MLKIKIIKTSKMLYGGNLYLNELYNLLNKKYKINVIDVGSDINRLFRYPLVLYRLLKIKGSANIWIRPSDAVLTKIFDKSKGKQIAIIHHIDNHKSIIKKIINYPKNLLFFNNLKKMDAIIVVSKFWENFLRNMGFKNIYIIYNFFNTKKYNRTIMEIKNFKKKYKLSNKPILYIGNCRKSKGALETYNTLKNLNIYLITTGTCDIKISAKNLNLSEYEYITLLNASKIVITMSQFKEGWCRIAHEAMLSKTPVIGSGLGGMRELLEDGGQIICNNFSLLKQKVEYLLKNKKERKILGEKGYQYAKKFTYDKFEKDWQNLIKNIL